MLIRVVFLMEKFNQKRSTPEKLVKNEEKLQEIDKNTRASEQKLQEIGSF